MHWMYYIFIINVVGTLAMLIDKENAKKHWIRIPEALLLLFALFGGSLGMIFGMFTFRHKTKKVTFIIGLFSMLLLNGLFAGIVFWRGSP